MHVVASRAFLVAHSQFVALAEPLKQMSLPASSECSPVAAMQEMGL